MKHAQFDRIGTVPFVMGLLRLSATPWAKHPLRTHLVARRRMFGIHIDDLAQVVGWNRMYLGTWESGSRTPTDKQLDDWIGGLDKLCAEACAPCHRSDTHRSRAA